MSAISLATIAAACACACRISSPYVACAGKLQPGDLVITEVFAAASSSGGGAGEQWFEIYNNTDAPAELEGLTLVHARPDGSERHTHVMREAVVAPGQYFTLGNAADEQDRPYLDYGYGSDLGELYGDARGGRIALDCDDTEVAATTYHDVETGHSRELTAASFPDASLDGDPDAWCYSEQTEFEAGNFGTPGQESDCEPIVMGECYDGSVLRPVITPKIGDLVITEVMPGPSKVLDADGEWFEAKAMVDLDLNGVALDRAGDSFPPDVLSATDCMHVAAGAYVVFAKSVDPAVNGGIPAGAVRGTFTFSLVAGSPASPGDVQIVAAGATVDAITWTSSPDGASLALDPGLTDPIANDVQTNFCAGTAPYGLGDLGTPSAVNAACPQLPPPGTCDDGGTTRAIVKPAHGALVISEIMPNPEVEPGQEWFEITNRGATAFDLNELGLDRADDTRAPDVIHSAACVTIAPGGYGLFARSADPTVNGGLPTVDATFGFTMINSGEGDVRVLDGDTVLDAVTWTTSHDGVSAQVEPADLDTIDNDSAASFCAATTPYGDGANLGTPKAANVCAM